MAGRFFFTVLIVLFSMCASKISNREIVCGQEYALKLATKEFKKRGYSLQDHNCRIKEDSDTIYIVFIPIPEKIEGGGAEFYVLKSSCKIVKKRLYQ